MQKLCYFQSTVDLFSDDAVVNVINVFPLYEYKAQLKPGHISSFLFSWLSLQCKAQMMLWKPIINPYVPPFDSGSISQC